MTPDLGHGAIQELAAELEPDLPQPVLPRVGALVQTAPRHVAGRGDDDHGERNRHDGAAAAPVRPQEVPSPRPLDGSKGVSHAGPDTYRGTSVPAPDVPAASRTRAAAAASCTATPTDL